MSVALFALAIIGLAVALLEQAAQVLRIARMAKQYREQQ